MKLIQRSLTFNPRFMMKRFFSPPGLLLLVLGLTSFDTMAQNQTELWGMTNEGGNGMGVIFKTDADGTNQEVMHLFLENPGVNPQASLCPASNGKFYGTTWLGGLYNMGLIFEYDPATNAYKKIVDFSGTATGSNPAGSLIQTANGKFYGMTTGGGTNSMGTLFEFDPSDYTLTKIVDFDGTNHGSYPLGSLTEASNGKLYAMTWRGGANDAGILFEFDITTGACEKKFDFDGAAGGSRPQGSLIQATNGKLYGATFEGGIHNAGVFFEYDYGTGIYTKLHDLSWTNDGGNPVEGLIQATNGKIYGTTIEGGVHNQGTFFEYDIAADTLIKQFDFESSTAGRAPLGRLMQSSDGKLWGMTVGGGANGAGVIYAVDLSGFIFHKKYDLTWPTGSQPRGGLVQTGNGKLYGMTYSGGDSGSGVLFEFNTLTSVYTTKINLNSTVNGRNIYGSLIADATGDLYGITMNGGINNMGVLFKWERANDSFIKLLDFEGVATGSYPRSSLMQASDGKFYATTTNGGFNDLGVLYQYDPVLAAFTKKYDFAGYANGSNPVGTLVETAPGMFYGVTRQGGTYDYGVIFEFDPSKNGYTKKHDFTGDVSGKYPQNNLVLASNGKLYGMTYQGGTFDQGILYEFDPASGNVTKKIDFNGLLGTNPIGMLTEAANGKLYGMTTGGGESGMGILFEYDYLTDNFVKKIDFNGPETGQYASGSLLLASSGKLYGMTSMGGLTNAGVLFEYDPATNILIKKLDFNTINGKSPMYTHLAEVCTYPECFSPVAEVNVCPGANTVIYVAATGNNLTYQWQADDGSGFTDISNNSLYAGVTRDTLQITGATPDLHAYQYRCRVTSVCPSISIYSDTAVLKVNPVYAFTESLAICKGETCHWQGRDFTESGTYTAPYQSVNGCDSLYTLHLTVHTVDVSITTDDPVITANASGAAYQWLDCDNGFAALLHDTLQSYTATKNGNYAVLIRQGSCVDTSTCVQITSLGVASFPDERLVIYPNPVSNELIIEIKGDPQEFNLEVINAAGNVVFTGIVVGKTMVQTGDFAPGIYLVKLKNGNKYILKKIIKE